MDRRSLLQWMVATGGAAALNRLSAQDLVSLGTRAHERAATAPFTGMLTSQELRTVEALAECIIPRTDTPGAIDAQVARFVEVMMSDWYPAADAQRFREGISAFEAGVRARSGGSFADLPQARQVQHAQVLDQELSALRDTRGAKANEHWFAILKYLTVWGYCTSEVAMRDVFHSIERPMRYDGAAPVRGDA